MKIRHLVNLRRWRRAREIFQQPFLAHLQLAWAARRPLSLPMLDRSTLTLHNARESRRFLSWVLEDSARPALKATTDGLVELRHEGYTVFIPPTDESFYTFNEVLLEDNYRLGKIRRPLGTVVDLGANIGLFAAKVVSMAERVICVEPVASNLAIAQRNAQHSDFPERVSFHNRAIAGQTGETIKIFLSDGNRGGHSIREDHADRWGCQGSEDAMTISLADLFDTEQIERCALLKCDIEGSEFEVFEAAPLELLARIDSIVMEVHLTSNEWNLDSLAGLRAKLKQAGFRVECEVEHDGEGRPSAVATLFATNLRVHGTPHSRKRNQSAAVHRRGP